MAARGGGRARLDAARLRGNVAPAGAIRGGVMSASRMDFGKAHLEFRAAHAAAHRDAGLFQAVIPARQTPGKPHPLAGGELRDGVEQRREGRYQGSILVERLGQAVVRGSECHVVGDPNGQNAAAVAGGREGVDRSVPSPRFRDRGASRTAPWPARGAMRPAPFRSARPHSGARSRREPPGKGVPWEVRDRFAAPRRGVPPPGWSRPDLRTGHPFAAAAREERRNDRRSPSQ